MRYRHSFLPSLLSLSLLPLTSMTSVQRCDHWKKEEEKEEEEGGGGGGGGGRGGRLGGRRRGGRREAGGGGEGLFSSSYQQMTLAWSSRTYCISLPSSTASYVYFPGKENVLLVVWSWAQVFFFFFPFDRIAKF